MRSGAPATCVCRSTPSARARLRRVRRAGGVALGSAGGCSTSPRCPARPCSYGLDTAAAASTAAGRGLALSLELDPRPWKLACSWKLMLRPRGMLWESESSPHQVRPSPHTHLRHATCVKAREVTSLLARYPSPATFTPRSKHASASGDSGIEDAKRDEAASDHGSDDDRTCFLCVHASYRASAPPLS